MNDTGPTEAATALTDLVLTMFRATNLMLAWGDGLVAGLGLTSARWQVLGAIVAADRPQPVAWLARDLGATRQNIQRIVNDLRRDGFVAFEPNPHHRRAQLVVLTELGRRRYDAALRLYYPKTDELAGGLGLEDIGKAHQVLAALAHRLKRDDPPA